jgi:hypothetical protein
MYMCPISNVFRGIDVSLYSSKIVDKKEVLLTVSNNVIYCSSDKVGTLYLYNTFSKISPSAPMWFATRVRTWRVARLSSLWRYFMRAMTSIALSRNPFGIENFFRRVTDNMTSSWGTLCRGIYCRCAVIFQWSNLDYFYYDMKKKLWVTVFYSLNIGRFRPRCLLLVCG